MSATSILDTLHSISFNTTNHYEETSEQIDNPFHSNDYSNAERTLYIEYKSSNQVGIPGTNNLNNGPLQNIQDIYSPINSAYNSPNWETNSHSENAKYSPQQNSGGSTNLKKIASTKSAEYLQKAERLISRISLRNGKFKKRSVKTNSSKEKDSENSCSYLKNYQVVGFSGKIVIAIDILTQETVAIKVIEKNIEERYKRLILPLDVSFMVPVIRYHETDFAVYLILKYVSGGKLLNHLEKFMKQPIVSPGACDRVSKYCSTIYGGQRLIEPNCEDDIDEKYDVSEGDKAFGPNSRVVGSNSNLVTECKSSIENYSNGETWDRTFYKSSLSSILPLPTNQDIRLKSEECVSEYLTDKDLTFQTKREDIESSKDEFYKLESNVEATNDIWFECKDKSLNNCNDNGSIGSNTLSGVTEDFSCSSNLIDVEDVNNCTPNRTQQELETSSSLPSLPCSQKEHSQNVTFDVNNLIQNSKKLINDVNKTLEKSKRQIFQTFSSDKEEKERDESKTNFTHCNMPRTGNIEHLPSPLDVCGMVDSNNLTQPSVKLKTRHCDNSVTQTSIKYPPNSNCNNSVPQTLYKNSPNSNCDHSFTQPSIKFPTNCNNSISQIYPPPKALNSHSQNGNENEDIPHTLPSISLIPPSELSSLSSVLGNPSSKFIGVKQLIPEGLVRVWVSQVISAMEDLHKHDIIWGDFNISNLLLDEGGSILVTYKCSHGNPKHILNKTFVTKKETDDLWLSSLGYLPPELLNPINVATRSSDWWSVGALLFHLLTGKDVASCHPCGITSHSQINFVAPVSEEAASLIMNLLCAHPMERLGSSSTGVQEIKDHPFFFGIQWP